ncbi:murein biosynthesis integral membrane protein MurJ [Candidatus Aquiluna sp. UB-MaderosW2red]|jgi:putative peptidoglycan lipid II flippase|uniref:murein biosynthesis integral membrane protein MurJ n=1 Tax=Candidatus Aquiluna sp. UB-MaderosW2red TaxID=1855377 RepID=UPI000875F081|nr:murein biosynthesis integral membrane protein MurJ [Candidatus Aquiluna sp. UB-MaderosW2red]SCX04442.1 putative peptidoglycan lipid II flippase [Candidatus Aquiluna sp. UB-MaderosW2red]
MSDLNPSVTRSSLVMASGTIVSRILGFLRAVLLAAAIGVTTDAADAFGVANQLPNNVYAIIVGGVLNAVLVPQLVRARSQADGGKGYVDRFVTLAITVFFAVTVIFTLAAPLLVQLYTSGWTQDQLALATAFAYWCLPQLFFYGLYSILGEVLNSRSAFGPFMWAPVLNNLVSIAGLVAFILIFGADPTGQRMAQLWGADRISLLAGSATVGVAAQALILLFFWKRIGLTLRLNFKWRGFGLGPAMKAASWSLAMVLVTQIGGVVQTMVASTAVAGRSPGAPAVASVAAAAIAWLIFMLPHSVVTVSIATAYFTRMSQHAAAGRLEEFKKDLTTGLRVIALVSVISSAILILVAYPVARVFVGEYPATVALGNVIMALMIGLVPFSFVYMMQRAFFALEDTRTPFIFTSIQISIHIAGSLTLGSLVEKEWLVVSISLLTAGTIVIQGVIAYALLKKRIGGLAGLGVGKALGGFVLAMIPAAGLGYLTLQWIGGAGARSFALDSVLSSVASSALVSGVTLLSYLVLLWVFRVSELRELQAQLRSRLKRG